MPKSPLRSPASPRQKRPRVDAEKSPIASQTKRGQGFVDECVQSIVDGESCASVVSRIRSQCTNINYFKNVLGEIKSGYLSRNIRLPGYEDAKARLRSLVEGSPCKEQVLLFLDSDLERQEKMMRQYRAGKWCVEDSEQPIHNAVKRFPLLPSDFETLSLTLEETGRLRKEKEVQRLKKQLNPVSVTNPKQMLDSMRKQVAIAAAKPYSEIQKMGERERGTFAKLLALSLLGLSGRRFVEIHNCRSTFDPVVHNGKQYRFLAFFKGQVKKGKNNVDKGRYIPLLVNFDTFSPAYQNFKRMQEEHWRSTKGVEDVSTLQNKDFQSQSNILRQYLSATPLGSDEKTRQQYRCIHTTKQLRDAYVQYVTSLFGMSTFAGMTTLKILGHEDLETGASYTCTLEWEDGPPKKMKDGKEDAAFPTDFIKAEWESEINAQKG